MAEYATVDQLRAEGVLADFTDVQLQRVIQRNSALIERWTRRWFYPQECTLTLDGSGHDMQQIGPPIIAITEVRILAPDYLVLNTTDEVVDPASIRVYNRHLTQRLIDPDDRNNPRIQYLTSWAGNRRAPNIFPAGWFPKGQQNVQVKGLFGYTDWDNSATLWEVDHVTPVGKTPELINLACLMLCVRDTLPLADIEGRTAAALSGKITQERTRDQSISYSGGKSTTSSGSGILGNAEIQALLAPFVAPASLGAV